MLHLEQRRPIRTVPEPTDAAASDDPAVLVVDDEEDSARRFELIGCREGRAIASRARKGRLALGEVLRQQRVRDVVVHAQFAEGHHLTSVGERSGRADVDW